MIIEERLNTSILDFSKSVCSQELGLVYHKPVPFGKTDQYFESHSQSRGSSSTITTNSKSEGTSKNFSIQERERIKPQDILQFDVGHFCGILVEGSNKEFNTRFKNISCEPVSMPERNFLFDVESNFRAIHAQIKELVQ